MHPPPPPIHTHKHTHLYDIIRSAALGLCHCPNPLCMFFYIKTFKGVKLGWTSAIAAPDTLVVVITIGGVTGLI